MDTDLRILIIEDRPLDAERCEHELRSAGLEFQSRRVCTRESFIAALRSFSPDLILSDFRMPTDLDGITALRIARRKSPDVPFIFVSGTIGEERAVEAAKAGAAGCVVKDKLHRLGPVVKRALQEARDRRRNEVKVLMELAAEFASAFEDLDQGQYYEPAMNGKDAKKPVAAGKTRALPAAPSQGSRLHRRHGRGRIRSADPRPKERR